MKRRYQLVGLSLTIAILSAPLLASESSSSNGPTRQGNCWGINLGWIPGWDTHGTIRLLGLARNLVGDWGYLRPGISPTPGENIDDIRKSLAMIRAHHLIPISGGASPDHQFQVPDKGYPNLDPDGTMRTAAQHRARIWREIYEAKIPFYAIEVMNEINIGDGWPAEKYAQWLYDYATAAKNAYPGIKICSCGMAGSGAGYYENMLAFKPELKQVVDFWGLHPYGANHPPEYRPEGCSLRCYEETKAALKKLGVDPIRLMCTETGYELEFSDTGKDPVYPPIGEENRAEYMARAFRDYYVPEPTIDVVAVFQMWDFPWHNWNGWDLMYHDGRPRLMYESMAAEPKNGGKDWMPTGPARIKGRITWRDTNIGIPRIVVYAEPGFYGGVTDDNGYYEIVDMPEGEYIVRAFADGFTDLGPTAINATQSEPGIFDGSMKRESIVPADLGKAGQQMSLPCIPGWTPYGNANEPGVFAIDTTVAYAGWNTQRITLEPGQEAGLNCYGDYSSTYPSEVVAAEVYVRSTDSRVRPGYGPYLELALTNGRGEPVSVAKTFVTDFRPNGRWHRITAAIYGPARSTRVRVSIGAEKATGTFWFSAPFAGEADFPLPSDIQYKTTGYVPPLHELNKSFFAQATVDIKQRNPDLKTTTVTGTVLDFRGRPLPKATVCTDGPLFVTLTDDKGQYTLTAPAGERMRVRAFALGETPAVSKRVSFEPATSQQINLQTAPPTANPTLTNGGFNDCHEKEAGLLPGWTGFGTTDGALASGHKAIIFQPKSYEGHGLYFAQSGSNTKNGGAYQIIEARPGQKYRLTGWVYTFTDGEAKKPMDNNCRLGIDPTGGRDPDSSDLVWTERTESEKEWTQISVEATAQTCRITVFLRHEMRRGNIWNLTLFDNLKLEEID